MKKAGVVLAVLLAVLAAAVVLRWEDITRLRAANSLFEPDRIVANFSSMEEAFLTRDLEVGEAPDFPVDLSPLPDAVGIGGQMRDLAEFLRDTDTTSLLVLRDGVVVFEDYFLGTGADDQRVSWSVAKSFLSGLVGRAVESGELSLNDTVERHVPELADTAYRGVSVRNLLNMASGVRFDEDYFDRGSDINIMGRKLAMGGSLDSYAGTLVEREFEPGAFNQYVSMDTHVLGMVLRAATGQSVSELFEEAYGQVGLGDVSYMTDGEGEPFVLGGLLMTTRGYAAFGELFRRGGEWDGVQVIPAEWVAESTPASAPPVYDAAMSDRTYGYQWWTLPDSGGDGGGVGDYFANGIYGQTVYVHPRAGVVVVKTSADREFRERGPSGKAWQIETIEALRGIAEHYGAAASP